MLCVCQWRGVQVCNCLQWRWGTGIAEILQNPSGSLDTIRLPAAAAAADIVHLTALKEISSIPLSLVLFFFVLLEGLSSFYPLFSSSSPPVSSVSPCFPFCMCFIQVFKKKNNPKSVRQRRPMVSNCHHQQIYTLLRFDPVTIGRANSTKSSIRTGHAPKIKKLVNHVTSSQCSRDCAQLT